MRNLTRVPVMRALNVVADLYDATVDAILSETRKAAVVEVRHVAMWLIWRKLGWSSSRIGSLFGDRDHTTVLHALRKIERRRDEDPAFHDQTEALAIAYDTSEAVLIRLEAPEPTSAKDIARRLLSGPHTALQVSVDELRVLALDVLEADRANEPELPFVLTDYDLVDAVGRYLRAHRVSEQAGSSGDRINAAGALYEARQALTEAYAQWRENDDRIEDTYLSGQPARACEQG